MSTSTDYADTNSHGGYKFSGVFVHLIILFGSPRLAYRCSWAPLKSVTFVQSRAAIIVAITRARLPAVMNSRQLPSRNHYRIFMQLLCSRLLRFCVNLPATTKCVQWKAANPVKNVRNSLLLPSRFARLASDEA